MLKDPASIALAAFFSFLGVCISIYQILCHLRNYTEPVFQRYIIRIIFMVPVYAIGSFCSLQWRAGAIYFDTLRDCYEAWIIYNFSALLLAYVGGPGAVVVKAEGKIVHPSWSHLTCCLPSMQVDGFFLRRCKQGTVQFVLLKPVMAALTLILYAAGAYTDGEMNVSNGYFYISILYNVCYTLALYGLILFWIGASELLQPFNPLLKFVLVKTVVFLTFWQGIGISCINSMGEISDPEDGKALQNFMICVEMAIAGVALLYAFPHKEYQMGGSTTSFRLQSFVHAISIRDVVSDAIHVFAPSYSDYVLYSDGGPADNVKRKKFRGQKGTGGDHPKAGKPMTRMEAPPGETDGRRSKTPEGGEKILAANRNQAILLDSDSDGIDSDDEGSVVGGPHSGDASDNDSASLAAAPDDDNDDNDDSASVSMPAGSRGGSRSARVTGAALQPAQAILSPRPTGDGDGEVSASAAAAAAAAAQKKLARRASSRKMVRSGNEAAVHSNGMGSSQQQQQQPPSTRQGRRTSRGLIKASYPAGSGPQAAATAAVAAAVAAATAAAAGSGGVADFMPVLWRYRGAILTDSDGSDMEQQQQVVAAPKLAAAAATAGLEAPEPLGQAAHTSSPDAAGKGAAATLPAAGGGAAPLNLPAPFTRINAAAVRRAVAGAVQAAGRATSAAANAAGSGRQAGAAAALEGSSQLGPASPANPIVLPSPRQAFLTATAASQGGPRSPAAMTLPGAAAAPAATGLGVAAGGAFGSQAVGSAGAAAPGAAARTAAAAASAWEPEFPGSASAALAAAQPHRQQRSAVQQPQKGSGEQWADSGWSSVPL